MERDQAKLRICRGEILGKKKHRFQDLGVGRLRVVTARRTHLMRNNPGCNVARKERKLAFSLLFADRDILENALLRRVHAYRVGIETSVRYCHLVFRIHFESLSRS